MNIVRWTSIKRGQVIKFRKVQIGGVCMRKLNINKLRAEKQFINISSEEALKDINPINWSKEVLEEKRKVEVNTMKN